MAYAAIYAKIFDSDLERLGTIEKKAVHKKMEQILQMPEHFELLRDGCRLRKARAGKFRIIFLIEGGAVYFFRVAKRDIVYKELA